MYFISSMYFKKLNLMMNYKNSFIILSCVIFTILYLISFNFSENIPYYIKNITDYHINLEDRPFKKNINVFFDLSLNVIIFLSIFIYIKNFFSGNKGYHLQLIWLIKSMISLFFIMIYETYFGLDQTQYFLFVSNNSQYAYHFGNLDKLFDLNNPTINFLLPLKIINFIFEDSWFAQKNFQNILYFISIVYFYKTLILINPRLKNNVLILYFYALIPSILFFSSFLTKDFLIISLISILIFKFLNFENSKRKLLDLLLLITILFSIYLLRWWITAAIIISCIMYVYLTPFKNLKFFYKYQILTIVFFIVGVYLFSFSIYFSELEFLFLDKIFARFTTEHFYPPENYNTLFLNAGNKFDVIKLYPIALSKTIFNPFVEEIYNWKLTIFVLENTILLALLILSFKNFKYNFTKKIFFILILFLLIAHIYIPISYLNAGTTLRYAIQIKYVFLIYLVQMNFEIFLNLDKKIKSFFYNRSSKLSK